MWSLRHFLLLHFIDPKIKLCIIGHSKLEPKYTYLGSIHNVFTKINTDFHFMFFCLGNSYVEFSSLQCHLEKFIAKWEKIAKFSMGKPPYIGGISKQKHSL
jgi:hypothetical protein